MQDVIIVGGGAAGMMAAICCARQGQSVLVFEHKEQVGKKIFATGNGKCNYTNKEMAAEHFRGAKQEFIAVGLSRFTNKDTIAFFRSLGIEPREKNGYVYPYSEQASSVVAAMEMEMRHLGVRIICEHVEKIEKTSFFKVKARGEEYIAKKLILAAGGKASPKLGSDGSGLVLARKLGHSIVEPVPALIGLHCREDYYEKIAGIRTQAAISLYIDQIDHRLAKERGELQITKYGISGIPVFQLSRWANRALQEGKKVFAVIDFMPDFEEKQLFDLLQLRFACDYKKAQEVMVGLLPDKMIPVILQQSGIKLTMVADKVKEPQLRQLTQQLKRKKTEIIDHHGFEFAQVMAGGVDTSEINENTMESKLQPGLYLAGEIMDVDGICGGYNLQWCWTSAFIASQAIAGI